MTLTVDGVFKQFGRFPALAGVSLEARDGEFLTLLGPSGLSGKTTLLRVLAGLDKPDSRLRVPRRNRLSKTERAVNAEFLTVFQQYALFRHMTVAKNIAFGLDVRPARSRPSRDDIRDRVEELLALARIDGLGRRYPAQLSWRSTPAGGCGAGPGLLWNHVCCCSMSPSALWTPRCARNCAESFGASMTPRSVTTSLCHP